MDYVQMKSIALKEMKVVNVKNVKNQKKSLMNNALMIFLDVQRQCFMKIVQNVMILKNLDIVQNVQKYMKLINMDFVNIQKNNFKFINNK